MFFRNNLLSAFISKDGIREFTKENWELLKGKSEAAKFKAALIEAKQLLKDVFWDPTEATNRTGKIFQINLVGNFIMQEKNVGGRAKMHRQMLKDSLMLVMQGTLAH